MKSQFYSTGATLFRHTSVSTYRASVTLSVFQMSDLNGNRQRMRQELKEKEEENQQVKEGLRAAVDEMTKLKLLLQVQRPQLNSLCHRLATRLK